jgi:hypothetical protein
MNNKDYIPQSEKAFTPWVETFMTNLAVLYPRFGMPAQAMQNLMTLHADYTAKLKLANDPATRTKVTVGAKNTAEKALKKALRESVKAWMAFNPLVTDDDRNRLGLPIYKTTHTPAPVAEEAPDMEFHSPEIRREDVHFYAKGQKKGSAKPAGQHGVEACYGVGDRPATQIEELIHSTFDTDSPLKIHFTDADRGKVLSIALRWENTRGAKGPWSDIRTVIIP